MKIASFVTSIFLLQFFSSASAEHVVCATADHTEACKRIEATRKDVKCLKVADSVDCLQNILKRKAHFGTFTPEEAILASYHINDEIQVVAELRHPEKSGEKFAFQTVVVVPKNFTGGLSALENTTYCHPGFTQGRYWSDRVLKYFESKVVSHFEERTKTENRGMTADEEELYKLSTVFRKACRPGAWSVSEWWDKKLKRDYNSLCSKCDFPSTCSYKSEAYNEHFSALKCLTEHGGDVAYSALGYVKQYFNLDSGVHESRADPDEYRFLCEDGSTRDLSAKQPCSWIRQPWTVVVSLGSAASEVVELLNDVTAPEPRIPAWKVAMKRILMNGGGVVNFVPGNKKLSEYIQQGRFIPKYEPKGRFLNWCTISSKEKSKCEYMASAALAFGVPLQINCTLATSKVDCLKKIQKNESDVTYIDTQLGFAARKVYSLTSVAFVETEKTGNYYGVVVTKGKGIKRFKDLKGKSACFPVYNGLGWLSHVHNVRRLNLVPNMLCSDSPGLWNYFSKACVPGAKSSDLNKYMEMTPNKLCEACAHKEKDAFCGVTPDNPYYSEIGALRCLNNGDGDVAVLDFHTIKQLFESGSNETNGLRLDDFKILCRDETLKDFSLDDPQECSITQLNGGEVVARENLSLNEKRDITLTLIGLDDLFGHSMKQYPPTFKMFEPFEGEPGLLFKDTAVALISVFNTQNEYVNNYLKLQSEMSACYRDNSATRIYISLLVTLPALILIFIDN